MKDLALDVASDRKEDNPCVAVTQLPKHIVSVHPASVLRHLNLQ